MSASPMPLPKINELMNELHRSMPAVRAFKPEVFYARTFPLDFDRAVHYLGVKYTENGKAVTVMVWQSPLEILRIFRMEEETVH